MERVCDPTLDEEAREAAWGEFRSGRDVGAVLLEAREYFTSEDAKVRSQAMKMLARLLEECDVSQEHVVSVADFCKGRADDASVSASALAGLKVCLERASGDRRQKVAAVAADCVFDGVFVPAYGQRTRQRAWDLIDDLARLDDFADGPRLAKGIAKALDGEKDPRCLLRALRCAEACASRFFFGGGGNQNDDDGGLFDAIEPYFPISFEPPPNDPYGVTPERLRRALRRAICATPALADRALRAAVVKLEEEEDEETKEDDNNAAAADREEALSLLAKAASSATTAGFASLAQRAAQILVVRKEKAETSQLKALESLAARAAADCCFTEKVFRNTAAPLLQEDVGPETVAGRFIRRIAIALARGGGLVAWRAVFDSFGAKLLEDFVEERRRVFNSSSSSSSEQNEDEDPLRVAAALEALVELLETPHPGLFLGPLPTKEALLAAIDDDSDDLAVLENDDLKRRVAGLRLRAFAALAERDILDDQDVTKRLLKAATLLSSSSSSSSSSGRTPRRRLESLGVALVSRIAAARPACAAAALSEMMVLPPGSSTTKSSVLVALGAAPAVLASPSARQALKEGELDAVLLRDLRRAVKAARRADRATANEVLFEVVTDFFARPVDDVAAFAGLVADLDPGDLRRAASQAATAYVATKSRAALTVLEVALLSGEAGEADSAACSSPEKASSLFGAVAEAVTDDAEDAGAATVLVALLAAKRPEDIEAELRGAMPFSGRWTCAARVALGARRPEEDDAMTDGDDNDAASVVIEALAGGDAEAASRATARILALKAPFDARFWRQRFYARLAPILVPRAPQSGPTARAVLALAGAAPRAIVLDDAPSLVDVAVAAIDDSGAGAAFLRTLLDAGQPAVDALRLGHNLDVALPKILDLLAATNSDDDAGPQHGATNNRAKLDALRCLNALAVHLPHAALFPFRRTVALALRKPLDDHNRELRRLAALVRNDWLANFGGSIV